jgi:uncharacterized damage-inducible protein DinB
MLVKVGLERNNEGRDLAWALDFPGCFAYGNDSSEAVVSLAQELVVYEAWVTQHSSDVNLDLGNFDIRVVDTWEVTTINDRYELEDGAYAVNAWFRTDWKPLSQEEVDFGVRLLGWTREDLLAVARQLDEAQLERAHPGERWSIRGILKHIANGEWWYMDRLGLVEAGRPDFPPGTIDRLEWVRGRFITEFSRLARQERVVGKDGEFWSPRKLLRRALWHEINHRRHILKLLETG